MENFVLIRPSLVFHSLPATPSTLSLMAILAIRYSVPTKGSIAAVTAIINNLCGSECVRFGWTHYFLLWCQNLAGGLRGMLVRIARKMISESRWRVNEGGKREPCSDDRKFFVTCTKKVSNCLLKI